MIKVAINGFGRIGRRLLRLLNNHPRIEVVAINDLADSKTLSHLLKYDSIHGVFNVEISHDESHIIINGKKIPLLNQNHPKNCNWKPYDVDFVIEATGKFKTASDLNHHIKNGAKRVILSVPPIEDSIKTIVLGVNDDTLIHRDDLVELLVDVEYDVFNSLYKSWIRKLSNSVII